MTWIEWYNSLIKPSWTPDPATIGLMWQIIYPIIFVTFTFVLVQAIRRKIPWTPRTGPSSPRPPRELAAAIPPAVSPAPAEVYLVAYPWAEVIVDDGEAVLTPHAAPLEISAGRHEVLFRHPRFGERRYSVELVETPLASLSAWGSIRLKRMCFSVCAMTGVV